MHRPHGYTVGLFAVPSAFQQFALYGPGLFDHPIGYQSDPSIRVNKSEIPLNWKYLG